MPNEEYRGADLLTKARAGVHHCLHSSCSAQDAANELLQVVTAEVVRLRQENARLRAELQMAEFLANAAR